MAQGADAVRPSGAQVGAGAAGAGGGTVLILLAQALPDQFSGKKWLVIVAPTVTVGLAFAFRGVRIWVARWIRSKKFREGKDKIANMLRNPLTSEDHKAILLKQFENLENLEVASTIEGLSIADQSASGGRTSSK